MLLQGEIYVSFIVRVCFQSMRRESFRLEVITRQVAKGLLKGLGGAGRNLRHSHLVNAYITLNLSENPLLQIVFFFFFFSDKFLNQGYIPMKMYSIQIKVFIILCIMKISKQASICFNIRGTLQAKYVRYSAVNRNIFRLFQKHI